MTEIAGSLQNLNTLKGDRVGIMCANYHYVYSSILGALAVGACYVPLNTDFPLERLVKIISHAQIKTVCCDKAGLDCLRGLKKISKELNLNAIEVDRPKAIAHQFSPPDMSSQDLAYIMYTSGTTGDPKGVMISHANVTAFLNWAIPRLDLNQKDVFSHHSRISFDLSVFDIFACFYSGGTICPIEKPMDLAFPTNFIKQNKISVMLSVPSVIGMMIKAGQLTTGGLDQSLRVYLVCGEALRPEYAKEWIKAYPNIPLYNIYGPTEATIACTEYLVLAEDIEKNCVPIGKPITESDLHILCKHHGTWEPVATGEIGELFISGQQLSKGYWRNKQQTEKVFLEHFSNKNEKMYRSGDLAKYDEKGRILWMGRADQQVQVQGYRVELSEIENALSQFENILECAVIFDDRADGSIIAVITIQPDCHRPNLSSIQKYCRQKLPEYMCPKKLTILDNLPKNSNGKIDRNALKHSLLGKP